MVSEGEKPSDWECELNAVLILVLVEDGLGAALLVKGASFTTVVLILVLVEDGLGGQLLELTVSETVVTKFLISLTFGDQKYVPFRVLSRMQIYGFFCELGVRVSKNFGFFDGVFGYFVGWRWSWG